MNTTTLALPVTLPTGATAPFASLLAANDFTLVVFLRHLA